MWCGESISKLTSFLQPTVDHVSCQNFLLQSRPPSARQTSAARIKTKLERVEEVLEIFLRHGNTPSHSILRRKASARRRNQRCKRRNLFIEFSCCARRVPTTRVESRLKVKQTERKPDHRLELIGNQTNMWDFSGASDSWDGVGDWGEREALPENWEAEVYTQWQVKNDVNSIVRWFDRKVSAGHRGIDWFWQPRSERWWKFQVAWVPAFLEGLWLTRSWWRCQSGENSICKTGGLVRGWVNFCGYKTALFRGGQLPGTGKSFPWFIAEISSANVVMFITMQN